MWMAQVARFQFVLISDDVNIKKRSTPSPGLVSKSQPLNGGLFEQDRLYACMWLCVYRRSMNMHGWIDHSVFHPPSLSRPVYTAKWIDIYTAPRYVTVWRVNHSVRYSRITRGLPTGVLLSIRTTNFGGIRLIKKLSYGVLVFIARMIERIHQGNNNKSVWPCGISQ